MTLRPSRQDGQEAGEEHKRIVGRSDLWLAASLEATLSVSVAEGMKVREGRDREMAARLISHLPLTFSVVNEPDV